MEDNYPKAYKEVVEILKYLPKESVEKIPQNIIEIFEKNMDKDYLFFIDENKNFEEQTLLDETKAIFANIFRDYWATPYQREKIIAKENNDRQEIEKEKRIKYNPDNIFNKPQNKNAIIDSDRNNIGNSNLPMEIKKERFYKKIINFIKKFFLMKK